MNSNVKTRSKVIIVLEACALLFLVYAFFVTPFISFVLFLLVLYDLKSRADRLIVDDKGITIKNWLTFEKRNYFYAEFDKVVIYLLKDDIIFSKVSGRNFDNLNALMDEIEKRKFSANQTYQ